MIPSWGLEALAVITGHLQETVGGIRVVKAFAGENFERNRFSALTKLHYENSFGRERLKRMVIPLNEFVGVVIISGLLYVGGELVLVRGTIGSEDFIRFLVLLFAVLNPILSLGGLFTNIKVAEASGGRVFELLDTLPDLSQKQGALVPQTFNDEINFCDVQFRYNKNEPKHVDDCCKVCEEFPFPTKI